MEITIAKREKIKIPILVTGASGSGKTVSSLIMAKGIIEKMFPDLSDDEQWKKIGVIDTEHQRSKYYADSTIAGVKIGEFMHGDFEPPYSDVELANGINQMKQAHVEVIILDSLSHLWSGEGGIQDLVADIQRKNPKAGMMAWNRVKENISNLLKQLTSNSIYIISTARSKTGYDMEKNERGKVQPVKIGLKPEIRDGWEYEFAVNFDIDENHDAVAKKDNTNMFTEAGEITKETGYKIYEWSSEGVDPEQERQQLIENVKGLMESNESNRNTILNAQNSLQSKLETWDRKTLKEAISHLDQTVIHSDEEGYKPQTSNQVSDEMAEQLRKARETVAS